jgi:CubicO group peptidase (beta-lactamase class C family)
VQNSKTYVAFPDAPVSVALPPGWTELVAAGALTVVGPEGDLRMSFVVRPISPNIEELLCLAWQQVNPGFDLSVRQTVEVPDTDGWDKAIQAVYSTPHSEGRIVVAVARVLGESAFISLIDATRASFNRRAANIAELHNAWRPTGLKEPSLAGVSPKTFGEQEAKAISEFVDRTMPQLRIPGMAIAIVQDGRTVYAEGFGIKRVGTSDAVTPQTRFMIGSVTKPLTTFMMARLVDMGRFQWSTPMTDVLPGFALADADVTRRLEMRHTVCACTGMPRRDTELLFRYRGVRPEDRISEMRQMRPTTGFGETFQYSNYLVAAGGYAAAHSYLPDATLRDAYECAMQQLVFEPLAMHDSSAHCVHSPLDAAPHGHTFEGDTVPIDPSLEEFADAVAPAGSVWSNVLDLARYVICELRSGQNEKGEQVISADNLLVRRRPSVKIDGKSSYGLGLSLTERQGLVEVKHGGNTRGFTAEMSFLPEQGIGMVMLTNVRTANGFLSAVEQRLLEILFGAESKAEAMVISEKKATDDSLKSMHQRVRTTSEATAWIANYVGDYASEELGPACIFKYGEGFRIAFESWSSDLGVEEEASGKRQIVMTSHGQGRMKLQVEEDLKTLLFNSVQTQYRFLRVSD